MESTRSDSLDKNDYVHLDDAINDLETNIRRYRVIGNYGLILTTLLFAALSFFVYHLFEGTLSTINELKLQNTTITYNIDPKKGIGKVTINGAEESEEKKIKANDSKSFMIIEGEAKVSRIVETDNTSMVVLAIVVYILRTSLLGSFVLLSLIYTVKFTTSSFDQAVRFTKRKHASQFLLDMFKHYDPDISNVPKIMDAFAEWNVNVESAYTDVNVNEKAFKTFFENMRKLDESSISKVKEGKA